MRICLAPLCMCLLLAVPVHSAEICIVPSPNGQNVTVDCDPANPQLHPNATIGYSLDGIPCFDGDCPLTRDYGWSISSSEIDPFENFGPQPPGIVTLYLWFFCAGVGDGWTAAEMSLETDENLVFLAFVPRGGILNVGAGQDLLLAVGGCPANPLVAGDIILFYPGPISTEPETWGGIKSMYR